MKIIAISDCHGYLPPIPPCDLFLIAGDICPYQNHDIFFQYRWITTSFKYWIENVPAKHKIITWGNHDIICQKSPELFNMIKSYGCNVLIDSMTTYKGLKIWGSPWTRKFFDWAFNLSAKNLYKLHTSIPKCDIILTHGPPYKFGDICLAPSYYRYNNKIPQYQSHKGSPGLLKTILKMEPKLVVGGHIHSGYGVRKLGKTTIVNASYTDEKYRSANPPIELDIE